MFNAIGINNVCINISFIRGTDSISLDRINKFKIKRNIFEQYTLSISFDMSRYDEIESIISNHICTDIKDITIKYGDYTIHHICFDQEDYYSITGYESSVGKKIAKIKITIDTIRDNN